MRIEQDCRGSLSSKLFRQIEDKSIENVFILCEELLNEHSWALGVIAFDFAYRYALEKFDKETRNELMQM